MPACYALFPTPIGACGIAWRDAAAGEAAPVCAVQLPERTDAATRARLRERLPDAVPAVPPPTVADVIGRLVAILGGARDDLRDVPVDLTGCAEFAQRSYEVLRATPPGETTTYGEIATRLGSPGAAREVGRAMGDNPVPLIVPCHRVVGAGGRMVGFSAAGGVQTKLRLLAMEGATYDGGQTALF